LQSNDVKYTETPSSDQFSFTMSVGEAETMFRTYFHVVANNATNQKWHRAADIHAPKEVVEHVAAVFGVHGLPTSPKPAALLKGNRRLKQNPPNIGPKDLWSAYYVGSRRGSGNVKARTAVAEFQGQFSNQADLTSFFQQFVPNYQTGDDQVYKYRGNIESGYGIEALLDIQYIMGVAPGVKTEFWGWQNYDFCTDLKNWTSQIIALDDSPLVFSVSYGWQGALSQLGCTRSEIQTIDANFMAIANRGISIIFASGDTGSAFDGTQLWPSWPASSPYVTAVGSTMFTGAVGSQQQATTEFGSGSGFSSMFNRPAFQAAAVNTFLTNQASQLPPNSVWSRNGRATADVSALGEGFQVLVDGSVEIVGGTSASTPTFSAMIGLINDVLVSAGKKPLGYLNPWLYKNPGAFTDIVLGSDKIDRSGNPLEYGFNCVPGWDPPSGLGTPYFTKLLAAA